MRASVQHWSSSQPQAAGPASSTVCSFAQLGRGELTAGPARAFGGQRRPASGGQRPPATGSPTSATTRNRRATSRSLAPASINPAAAGPHLLPPRPLGRAQPTTIGIPHASGIPHDAPAGPGALTPAFKDL